MDRIHERRRKQYLATEFGDFAVFGGFAVEHAAKAKLAAENPMLISMDVGATKNLLAAIAIQRASDDISLLPHGVKTVGAVEALSRICAIDPGLRHTLDPALDLIRIRNGEAHMGVRDERHMHDLLVIFLRAVNALIEMDPTVFWHPHNEAVSAAVDEAAAETRQTTTERIAAGRVRYQRRFGELGVDDTASMLAILESRRDLNVDNEESLPIECPACEAPATVHGESQQTDLVVDYDDDGLAEAAWPEFTFFAAEFECEACGLKLATQEELEIAGLQSSWENDLIDVDDWMRSQYETDDDRDR